MQNLSLKERFRASAGNSRALRFLFNNARAISTAGNLAGQAIILYKNGLQPGLETAATALFLTSIALIALSRNRPGLMTLSGATTASGGAVFSASAYGKPGFMLQTLSMCPTMFSGLFRLLGRKKGEATEPPAGKPLKNILTVPFNLIRQYPVAASGMVKLPFRPFLLAAALMRGDYWLAATALSWSVGDIGLAAADSKLRKAVLREGSSEFRP